MIGNLQNRLNELTKKSKLDGIEEYELNIINHIKDSFGDLSTLTNLSLAMHKVSRVLMEDAEDLFEAYFKDADLIENKTNVSKPSVNKHYHDALILRFTSPIRAITFFQMVKEVYWGNTPPNKGCIRKGDLVIFRAEHCYEDKPLLQDKMDVMNAVVSHLVKEWSILYESEEVPEVEWGIHVPSFSSDVFFELFEGFEESGISSFLTGNQSLIEALEMSDNKRNTEFYAFSPSDIIKEGMLNGTEFRSLLNGQGIIWYETHTPSSLSNGYLVQVGYNTDGCRIIYYERACDSGYITKSTWIKNRRGESNIES